MLREQDKHFLASLYAAAGVIFAWKGVWEGIYEIPVIGGFSCPNFAILANMEGCSSLVFLFIGFAMLTLSGSIFSEFDPLGGIEKAVQKRLKEIINHPQKVSFSIIYHDKFQKKDVVVPADKIIAVEESTIVLSQGKNEVFIPTHRLKSIQLNGEDYWRF